MDKITRILSKNYQENGERILIMLNYQGVSKEEAFDAVKTTLIKMRRHGARGGVKLDYKVELMSSRSS